MVIGVPAGEGALGSLLPSHLELKGRQLRLPFGVGLLDLLHFHHALALARRSELGDLDRVPGVGYRTDGETAEQPCEKTAPIVWMHTLFLLLLQQRPVLLLQLVQL